MNFFSPKYLRMSDFFCNFAEQNGCYASVLACKKQ